MVPLAPTPSPRPDSTGDPPVLEGLGLTRRFGDTAAVAGVDLAVARGEYFCIVGPSGSGKSTLLRMLAGFETPDTGEIRLAGRRVDGLPPEKRDLNTVFQGYALFPHLSVAENVGFGLRMRGIPREERRRAVQEALSLVRLGGYGERFPRTLSGGEQQRVALARAVVNRPTVLLLDEPLAALDRKLRTRMQEELRRIQREVGITFIHVTHDQQEALRLGDRLAVMHEGRFLQVGPPARVYQRPATTFVADFLGTANLLDGVVAEGGGSTVRVGDGILLTVAADDGLPPPGSRIRLALRPEAVGLLPGAGADGPGNVLRGRVERREAVGGFEELFVRVGPLLLEVHLASSPSRRVPGSGEEVHLWVDPSDLVLLQDPGTVT
jgi:spermidine/putrescine transport system ATP-binding protein